MRRFDHPIVAFCVPNRLKSFRYALCLGTHETSITRFREEFVVHRTALSTCISAVIATLTLPLFTPAATAGPTQESAAETVEYVAMGDSYASGVGTGHYNPESGECSRGPLAYPSLLTRRHQPDVFDFVACGGATTPDVRRNQVGALDPGTDVVTISIGGNDAGFGEVMTKCSLGGDRTCDSAVSEAEAFATDRLPSLLTDTYADIASAAPSAEVFVVGYPRLFESGPCLEPFSEYERRRLNEAATTLNEVVADQATAAGFEFLDVVAGFTGHGVCAAEPWINGLSYPIQESFHPNAAGHAHGYLPVVETAFDSVSQSSRAS